MNSFDDGTRIELGPSSRIVVPRRFVRRLTWMLAILAFVHPVATVLARFDWRADLVTHFREPALVLTLAAALAMASLRRGVAAGLMVFAFVQAWGLSGCWWPNPVPPDPRSPARLRVLSANLLVDNEDRESLIRLVRRERPDVLALMEVSRAWVDGLEPIRSEYPFRFDHPSEDDGAGLSLWCRSRPTSVDLLPSLARGGMPAIRAVVDFGGRPLHLWLIHLVSPLERPGGLEAGREFTELADRLRREGSRTLAVGDFNSTDGSPHFLRFLDRSGLRDSRLGFGRQGSWPGWSPYRIGIDHAFLTADLAVVDRRLGPPIGSDHLPMLLEVAPAASTEAKPEAQVSQSSVESGSAEPNLTRSASRSSATSRSTSAGSSRPAGAGSAAISSVVFDPQVGPKAPINAPRTTSDEAINR